MDIKGYSLHIGLNKVDHGHYAGWDGKLRACRSDAEDMALMAQHYGLEVHVLLDERATRENVINKLKDLSYSAVQERQIFFLTYSGHGGQVPDRNNDESDKMDETWCLYNGQLIDDELYHLLSLFPSSSLVIVFSDSCHSGTMIKDRYQHSIHRNMPSLLVDKVYEQNRSLYDSIEQRGRKHNNMLLISGCQDNQYSEDGSVNGAFTSAVLRVWNKGKFKGDWKTFHKSIVRMLPPRQTPNLMAIGNNNLIYKPIFIWDEKKPPRM